MAHKKHHHKHHSDPIVGGESEAEGHVWGHGERANMPQQVMFKEYPKANEAGPMILDDTQGHINKVQKQGKERVHAYMSNQH
jgi:hypothetical protein